MKKRMLALFLCLTMIFSMLPGQALAEGEEPGETQPQVTEPAATEPAETEPEITEPETTEPEATEPEATEPEETEPEGTEPQDEPSAQAELPGGSCDYSLTWTFDEASGVLAISGSGRMKNYSSGYPWKQYVPYIQQVTVSEGIRQLGEYAFEDCVKLTSVSLPSTLETWDSTVFDGCTSLAEVNIAEGNSNYSSQDGIVYSADGAVLVYYPIGRTETTFTIPSFVAEIGEYAFEGVQTLAEVIIPENVTTINSYAFSLCAALKSVKVLAPVETIGYRTFFSCNALESITFSEGTTTLENSAFYFSSANLKSVTFPGTLVNFSYLSFDCATNNNASSTNYCKKVTSAGPIGSGCDFEFGWTGELPTYAFDLFPELEKIIIPDTITGMDGYSMRHHLTKITSVGPIGSDRALEYGWTAYIPSYAFPYGVQEIYLPVTVTSISANASVGCSLLTDVYYDGTQAQWADITIDETGNSCLLNATIHCLGDEEPELLTGECGYSATWTFDKSTGLLTISGSGSIFDFGRLTDSQGIETGEIRNTPWKSFLNEIISVRIEEGITYIGNEAFKNASNLVSVYAPTVISVGERAFYKAANLATADIPVLRSIDDSGFSGCKALTSLPLPDNFSWFKDFAFQGCGFTEFSLPGKVTSLPFLFEGCADLKAVFIPSSVTLIGNTTFWNCTSLTDIYYEGSQEDWAAIYYPIKSPDEYNNATIHYNCTGLFEPAVPATQQEVRYYSNYDADAMAACFGGGLPNCFVTEETDAAFTTDPEALIGQYVLVEYSRDDDGIDTLISMTALETGVTTITTISSSGITIGDKVYPMAGGIDALEVYLGEIVLYHTLNGELVSIEILQESQGYLSSWIQSKGHLIICPDKTMLQDETFPLSNYADQDTITFLSGISSMPGIAVNYWTDKLGYVLHLELGGYSAINNGWCFPNLHLGFGYSPQYTIPAERFEDVFGPSYLATANAAEHSVFLSMYMRSSDPNATPWGGNCHGMSITSMLFYLDMLSWENYSNGFSTVNLYYHQLSPQIDSSASTLYANAGTNSNLTTMIEHYQILQKNVNHGYSMENSTYSYLSEYETAGAFSKHIPGGNYIQRLLDTIWDTEEPLLATMQATDSAHAVVIRTDKPPASMGNGWYRVYIYDPNTPYIAQHYIDQTGINPYGAYLNRHSEDRYIELNPSLNVWRYNTVSMEVFAPEYWGSDAAGNVLYKKSGKLGDYSPHQLWVCPLSDNVPLSFDGTEEWTPRWEAETTIIYVAGNASFRVLSDQDILLCEFVNGVPSSLAEGVTYMPYAGITADGAGNLGGTLSLPGYDFQIEFGGGGDISVIGPEFAYNIASDYPANISVAMNEGTVVAEGTDGGEILMQLTHIYSNSEYTSVVADGTLEAGDSVTLTLDENTFTGSLTGSGSLELLTDNHNAPESRPLHNLTEGSGTVEIADVTAAQDTIRVALDEAVFAGTDTLYADGQPCAIIQSETGIYVDVPEGTALLVAYTWHVGDETDIHTKYPTGMQVYRIVNGENGYTAEYIPELDNLLQYSGASIRIVGVKGIRMITSITKGNKSALTGEGLAVYTLEEYGTALCWATDLAPGEDLVLGKEYTRSNYAYKKGVADPIFAQTADLIQYTNVLVGFDDDQCIPDIVMRPYIILSNAEGNQVTLYGGSIHRSIGYIAYQNRNVFKPGSASYDYVWGIIHHVYGDRFDEDYQG